MDNKDTSTYSYLDHLPPIPEEFLHDFPSWINNPVKYNGSAYRVGNRDGQQLQNAHFSRHHISDHLEYWLRHNISDEYSDIGILFTRGHTEHLPHSDGFRDYSLNFLLDTGGDQVDTVYYHDTTTDSLWKPRGYWPKDLDSVKEVERVRLQLRRWVLLNTQVLHGVLGITGVRTQISLSFQSRPKCAEKYPI